jgi:hypothetical protein
MFPREGARRRSSSSNSRRRRRSKEEEAEELGERSKEEQQPLGHGQDGHFEAVAICHIYEIRDTGGGGGASKYTPVCRIWPLPPAPALWLSNW